MSTIVRLDKIKANAHIVNFVFDADLENGRIVALGDLDVDGETYKGVTPTDVTTDRLVLHASVPMGYDEPDFEDEFVLEKGKEGRGYILETGDIITITDDAFATVPEKNDLVAPVNGDVMLSKVDVLAGEKLAFKAIAKEYLAGKPATVLEVL